MNEGTVTCLVIGAGQRGFNYSDYARLHPDQFKIIGVAEKSEFRRNRLKDEAKISQQYAFIDWRDAAKLDRFADCAIISTQDREHKEPAIAFARKGYNILLEKPMAVNEDDCREIVKTCKQNGVILTVCHVMRYTPEARKIKELITNGSVGEVVNIQLIEPVGSFHFSHSYVRGNWRREELSSCSLLAKSCHDIDLIVDWMEGTKWKAVSSFGSLKHFRKENKPEGASDRCLSCHLKHSCPYSATNYLDHVKSGNTGWPVSVLADNPDIENITEALKIGPYGRCVYNCDNDVVDNQVVNMEFENGSTASFTMVAFTKKTCVREVKIFGTKGEIRCEFDENLVKQADFVSGQTYYHTFKSNGRNYGRLSGHGCADYHTMKAFVDAVAKRDESQILSGADQTLQSHLLVFAAEKSRLTKTTVLPQLN